MELKSMKLTKKEATAEVELKAMDAPQYPWGLRLELNDESMAKLGMKSLPSVGQKMILVAEVDVTSVSEHESQGSGKRQHMSLQITDMAVELKVEKKDAAKNLYGESK